MRAPFPPSPQSRLRSGLREGFTLIEILVTITILSFGCLAALMMQSSALKGNNMADSMTVATFLAESEMERVKSLTFEELTAEIDAAATVTRRLDRLNNICEGADFPACQRFPFTLTTSFFRSFPTTYSHQVEVEVAWTDNMGRHSILYSAAMTDLAF
ncbi:MAG: prepilin-type N-terminal cleavage/methylation domain-containing protein [Deltaproteobacteria bacterium]|jgi:prepilin-type N-terminal cleavage/methylation domain-containing protein|nr:prepilin-type N-terminal cleavage/methylation domain-containing protein [Deltaproteobacteria bacterium]